jgi:hypothetical protein
MLQTLVDKNQSVEAMECSSSDHIESLELKISTQLKDMACITQTKALA